MAIDPKTVAKLRSDTGAGMMDCKRALTETEGDLEAAVALLREKGLASAAKKSGRVAAEGKVGVFTTEDAAAAVMVELNCETDFVAKNEQFDELLGRVGESLLRSELDEGDGETAAGLTIDGGKTVSELLTESVSTIGENLSLRRFKRMRSEGGIVGSYVHAGGKIGVLLELSGGTAAQAELAKSLCMQVAAALPRAVSRDEISEAEISAEREIYKNQALASGKPENIVDRIVDGKIGKFYGEVCLLEQEYVRDSDLTITKLLERESKEAGVTLQVARFERYQLGEGIEKREQNLAAEVAEQIAGGS